MSRDREELRREVTEIVSRVGEISQESIQPGESLHRYGIDSLAGVNIAYELSMLSGRDAPPTLLTELDTIDKLVDFVIDGRGSR